ncbi:Na(+)/H(+) antiporter subunit D [Nisaea acidiphila]|uniref:Na(+)/H(+) antiporter subunit D n=1 Tax=Nisaea acidiphila TaxID=1862145 RepID=A0A9J7AQY8_9PROT|nr:Na(+)/H(+) antiporter subunit D [Nisaea acidiphila]UUX50027.1 Na(+)/H(+) antiporter subunit D [Nisaea acidiphila]
MIADLLFPMSPGILLALGGLLVPFIGARVARIYVLALPAVLLAYIFMLPDGSHGAISFLGFELELLRIDNLSRIFATIFMIAAILGNLYAWHEEDPVQRTAAQVYAGSAIAAALAGDMISLFVFWELTAISSVFLIWASGTDSAFRSGMRYLIIQVGSGVILLTGLIVHVNATGSIAFDHLGLDAPGAPLILLAFGIKCAFPLLHNWLQDAYAEATVTGTVVLSAFTTKLAVYTLARGFAGTEMLIWIGAAMTAFPIFYAVIENDLRRVLAYSLNNQLGFMVVGVGIGSELALNGTAAHAFCHILYKALLFMSMGAVLFRTGTCKGSELGGLYKTMPLTMIFCVVGAASISAFPLFSGFVSKSLIMSASGKEGYWFVWGVLLFASAGVFHHSGIKIPYFAFFAHDSGQRPKEAPVNMLLAMGAAAVLCVGIGVWPEPLYALLPYDVDYVPYTTSHVITQLQLLMFSALAFTVLMLTRIYPPELKSTNLDFDWVYRRLLPRQLLALGRAIDTGYVHVTNVGRTVIGAAISLSAEIFAPGGLYGRMVGTGNAVALVAILLLVALVVSYSAV